MEEQVVILAILLECVLFKAIKNIYIIKNKKIVERLINCRKIVERLIVIELLRIVEILVFIYVNP
jgi:hypothetical protein